LKSPLIASPDSSCSESTRIVLGAVGKLSARDVAEDFELAGHGDGGSVRRGLFPTGDVVEHHFRDVGVVADDDEHGGRQAVGTGFLVVLPALVALGVVGVQGLQGAFQGGGQLGFSGDGLGLAAFLRQVVADAEPEVAVGGQFAGHGVVGHGDARDFDDAGLDGVDQGEIGHNPGK
jgi:hypothetical protein